MLAILYPHVLKAEVPMKRALAILGSAIFLVIAPGTLAGYGPWAICRWRMAPPFFGFFPIRMVGVLLIAAGLPVLLDSFARFAIQGLGTPAPVAPPQRLVVTGLYRYVRNPIYVAVVLGMIVFGAPANALEGCLYLGLALPFVAGLEGVRALYRGVLGMAETLPPERRCRRECFLRRLTLSWAAVYTAVAPVMIYRLWELFAS